MFNIFKCSGVFTGLISGYIKVWNMLYSFGFLHMFYNKFEKILYIGRSGRLSLETFFVFQKPKPWGENRPLKLAPPPSTIIVIILDKL